MPDSLPRPPRGTATTPVPDEPSMHVFHAQATQIFDHLDVGSGLNRIQRAAVLASALAGSWRHGFWSGQRRSERDGRLVSSTCLVREDDRPCPGDHGDEPRNLHGAW